MQKGLNILLVSLLVGMTSSVQAEQEPLTLEELRLLKRFGVGFSAAGPLSLVGMEIDINLTESFSIGAGLGTGMNYKTFMVKGRYFLLGESVSPYIGGGVARWWTDNSDADTLSPSVLANKFLPADADLSDGFDIAIVYPVLGVQFMHPMGLSVFAELQYLFKLFNMANGTYAGLGMHWYF